MMKENKIEQLEEEIEKLKDKLLIISAHQDTVYGILAEKKIIDDKKFQKDVDEHIRYIERDNFI